MAAATAATARCRRRTGEGDQVTAGKTVAVPADAAYAAWADVPRRAVWLPQPVPDFLSGEAFLVRQATPEGPLRLAWVGRGWRVDVAFHPLGQGRTRVSVTHRTPAPAGAPAGAPTRDDAEALRRYWTGALERFSAHLDRLKAYFQL